MAQAQITVGPVSSTLTASDANVAAMVQTYNRIHGAPEGLTNQQALDWFWRHVLRAVKTQVDEVEIGEAARDAAQAARDDRAGDVFG